MSRVLKFRAWDKKKNRWAREWDRDLEDREDQVYEKEYSEDSYWLDGDVASDLDLVNGRLSLDYYIWEQYTGLKDKDGKDIYEGDIVDIELHFGTGNEYIKGIVGFDYGCFSIKTIMDGHIHPLHIFTSNTRASVIGNVHENKDLLDGGN